MNAIFSTRLLFLCLVAFSVLVCLGQAFVVPSTTCTSAQRRHTQEFIASLDPSPREGLSVSLSAKKKRRRRKKASASKEEAVETPSVEPPVGAEELPDFEDNAAVSDELPDFDLGGEDGEAAGTPKPKVKVNPEEITANMMGSSMSSDKSLNELISDRSLENRFEFEEKGDPSIPDFVDLAQASSTTPSYSPDSLSSAGVGKKKQRQAERVARAIAAKEAEGEEESILAKFFPQLLDEKGNFSAIKLTEQGAWVGIILLVAWEVYINSPFFERAAPLAPVVFEIVTKSY